MVMVFLLRKKGVHHGASTFHGLLQANYPRVNERQGNKKRQVSEASGLAVKHGDLLLNEVVC